MVIGVTGYAGSGKSLVCELLKKSLGYEIISCDEIAKEISKSENVRVQIEGLKKEYSEISLVSLSENKELLQKMNDLIHPLVWDKVKQLVENLGNAIVETALPNKNFFEICDYTINITVNDLVRVNRIMERNKLDSSKIQKILQMQKEYEEYYNKCNIMIDNSDNIIELGRKLDEVCKSWKRK